jgi:THO complex subunit 1
VFCGRVFIFVFQCFPLGDRSSVNRHGDYNSENVTTFDKVPQKESSQINSEDTMMLDATPSNEDTSNSYDANAKKADDVPQTPMVENDELYPVFWGLQKSFAYPPSVWEPATLAGFKSSFEATLEKFKEMRNVLTTSNSEQRRGIKRTPEEAETYDLSYSFTPKYLTSRELFELEVRKSLESCLVETDV